MDHLTTTMAVVVKKRRRRSKGGRPQWGVVRGMLHRRIKDVAKELDVPISNLRHLCHKNGYRQWPGKQMRRMNITGLVLGVGAPEGSASAGLAGPSQQAKVAETKKNEAEKDITGIQQPVVPPREELVTLNLIDKVGSSSSSKSN